MSRLRSEALPDAVETQYETEPLPLFRPEALSKRDKFFGEALLIRPIPTSALAWLVAGFASLVYCVLSFGTYTETASARGIWLPGASASVEISNPGAAIEPGAHISIRCLRCADWTADVPATVRAVSTLAATGAAAGSASRRQIVALDCQTCARRLLAPGTAVELAAPAGRRPLIELFEPSPVRGRRRA